MLSQSPRARSVAEEVTQGLTCGLYRGQRSDLRLNGRKVSTLVVFRLPLDGSETARLASPGCAGRGLNLLNHSGLTGDADWQDEVRHLLHLGATRWELHPQLHNWH